VASTGSGMPIATVPQIGAFGLRFWAARGLGQLEPVEYTYQVKARDMSVNVNEGQWSPPASATTVADDNRIVNGGFEYGYPDGRVGFAGASTLSLTCGAGAAERA